MEKVCVQLEDLLDFRRAYNREIYITDNTQDNRYVDLFVQASETIVLCSKEHKENPLLFNISKYCNKPISKYDKRIVTHNFTDISSWPVVDGVPKSNYIVVPGEGKKFVITYIQIRFPKNIKLKETNKLYFSANLYDPAIEAVRPVIYLAYGSLKELVRKTNTPIQVPFDIIEDISDNKMVELEFKYADPESLIGSPIILRSALNEYIEIGLTGDTNLKDINNLDFNGDEAWAVINGKELIDF